MLYRVLGASVFAVVLSASQAQAAMVCTGKTTFGDQLQLTVNDTSATVVVTNPAGAPVLDATIPGLANVWDGHETGLITGPGLSVRYASDYGCFRRVAVTTNVRGGGIGYIETIELAGCLGGTSPDALCFPHGVGN